MYARIFHFAPAPRPVPGDIIARFVPPFSIVARCFSLTAKPHKMI